MTRTVYLFDAGIKIFYYFVIEKFMELFHLMDLLKIFRMQEPVSKDLLARNNELGKYKEVVQEKDALLTNSKSRIEELELSVSELKRENLQLTERLSKNLVNRDVVGNYEKFYTKIMMESEHLIQEKKQAEERFQQLEEFCKDLVDKYEKTRHIVNAYETEQEKLRKQIWEYEKKIHALITQHKGMSESSTLLKEHKEIGDSSMFEPLKGLN
ncbi:uncharacterized protein LOC115888269 [Sitophilus oryzae]|uniref:Uncharacterized protein LOC115888269 n=1 Tax=Sitophilus oryzae TaxID=7048 RepID=A0A6J2YK84_SITOR|nr:uncharacterized protein LOC115888269 [Sitophilus oryzae]